MGTAGKRHSDVMSRVQLWELVKSSYFNKDVCLRDGKVNCLNAVFGSRTLEIGDEHYLPSASQITDKDAIDLITNKLRKNDGFNFILFTGYMIEQRLKALPEGNVYIIEDVYGNKGVNLEFWRLADNNVSLTVSVNGEAVAWTVPIDITELDISSILDGYFDGFPNGVNGYALLSIDEIIKKTSNEQKQAEMKDVWNELFSDFDKSVKEAEKEAEELKREKELQQKCLEARKMELFGDESTAVDRFNEKCNDLMPYFNELAKRLGTEGGDKHTPTKVKRMTVNIGNIVESKTAVLVLNIEDNNVNCNVAGVKDNRVQFWDGTETCYTFDVDVYAYLLKEWDRVESAIFSKIKEELTAQKNTVRKNLGLKEKE